MLIEVVGKDSYKRESTLRVLEQALPQTYLKRNRISIKIIEDDPTMERKAFLYPGLDRREAPLRRKNPDPR